MLILRLARSPFWAWPGESSGECGGEGYWSDSLAGEGRARNRDCDLVCWKWGSVGGAETVLLIVPVSSSKVIESRVGGWGEDGGGVE